MKFEVYKTRLIKLLEAHDLLEYINKPLVEIVKAKKISSTGLNGNFEEEIKIKAKDVGYINQQKTVYNIFQYEI